MPALLAGLGIHHSGTAHLPAWWGLIAVLQCKKRVFSSLLATELQSKACSAGFYMSRIAYYTLRGTPGFDYSAIPNL